MLRFSHPPESLASVLSLHACRTQRTERERTSSYVVVMSLPLRLAEAAEDLGLAADMSVTVPIKSTDVALGIDD